MNVCVIPAFNRPEYLQICLEHIQKADGCEKIIYLFALDIGASPLNLDIIKQFPFENYTVTPKNYNLKLGKQSHNVINGLLAGANMSDGLIYYIEDDVFIGKDFFTFHNNIHAREPEIFCSILSKNVNAVDKILNDSNRYYVKQSNEYQGIGSCYKSKMILEYLLPDFNLDYFKNQKSYITFYYPDSILDKTFVEQDGLIRRIIEKNKLLVAFSHLPRCFHAGFYGYHRFPKIKINRMSMEQKIKLIKETVYDVENLRKISEVEYYVNDSYPINLETSHKKCIRKDLKVNKS